MILLFASLSRFGVINVHSEKLKSDWDKIARFEDDGRLGMRIRQRFINKGLLD